MIEQGTLFEVPKYVSALMNHVQEKITRIHWSMHQQAWDGTSDPRIDGLAWTVTPLREGPPSVQLTFEQIELRWIGATRQHMSSTVSWTTNQWVAWFERLMATIDV